MLRPTRVPPFERILAFGIFGSGKTYAWLKIAQWAHKTKSPARFFVIDTDAAVERMLWSEEFKDVADRVIVRPVFEWPEYVEALNEFLQQATEHDWIIVDMIGSAWDAVQSYFVDEVFEKDIGQYFLEVRKARENKKNLAPFEGWKDWPVINKLYLTWATKLAYQARCHVFVTTQEDRVTEEDEKQIQTLFGGLGFKPKGQKQLGHQYHTVLRFHYARPGDWRVTTIKDRQRPMLDGQPVKDFVLDYLVKVAQWRL